MALGANSFIAFHHSKVKSLGVRCKKPTTILMANDESSKGSQRSSSDIISKFKTFSDTKKVLSNNKCTSLNTAMKYLLFTRFRQKSEYFFGRHPSLDK